jgi:diadenylate cyclase
MNNFISDLSSWLSRHLYWLHLPFYWMNLPSFSITATDVVEILILGWLVFRILNWIKSTHAWALLRGILVLGVAVTLIYLFQMDSLIYLINQGLSIAIITGVVVFQPELRKVLESLGEREILNHVSLFSLFRSGKQVEQRFSDRTVEELVRASVEMAGVKTGALIVIEQNENLHEYERTGIEIDALVTSQLLINIFEHNTPLHDGAVIVRGDRVTAATCYLPLSDNKSLSKALGTRHRAGVGVSEMTDSFTIIVSEETGGISTAYRGELQRNITQKMLHDRLVELQNKAVVQKKKRRTRRAG